MEVKSVKFTIPDDEIQISGLVELLQGYVPKNNTTASASEQDPLVELTTQLLDVQRQYRAKDDTAEARELNAAKLQRVPLEYIIEIYVDAFATVCPNLKVMQFPIEWEKDLGRAKHKWGVLLGWNTEWKNPEQG